MIYRKDIDGLRAIAVLLVVIYHGKIPGIPGGFIGVDVFFAISGFLITSIIYPQILAQTFSFKDFYLRRARRLLPASVSMITLTTLAFALFYPPDLFATVIQSALSAALFVSNIFFWQTSGYFSSSVSLQPLLHTWSLSVEEQFYFVFPFLLIVISSVQSLRRYALHISGCACLVSLLLAIKYAPNPQSFIGFYVLPTRFYEMGLGAILAVYTIKNGVTKNRLWLREIGLLCILLAAFTYHSKMSFPSYYPLLPVCGALLMLADRSQQGVLYRLLCWRPIVFIGLISYSLYLWHWPIWVGLTWFYDVSITIQALYIVCSLLFSIMSYYWVEQPLRQAGFYTKNKRGNTKVFALSGLSIVSVVALGYLFTFSNAQILLKPSHVVSSYTAAIQSEPKRDECTDYYRHNGEFRICNLVSHPHSQYRILLWGDSHASALMSSLVKFSHQFSIDAFNTSGCPSLLGIKRPGSPDCELHNEYIKDFLVKNPETYDLVVNVSAWQNYIDLGLINTNNTQNPTEALVDGILTTKAFYRTHSVPFIFIAQPPKFPKHVPIHHFKSYGKSPSQTIPADAFEERHKLFKSQFSNNDLIELHQYSCIAQNCLTMIDDTLIYQDSHHISVPFAEMIAPKLETKLIQTIRGYKS